MDGSRFDDLVRALGAGVSRRQGLCAALGLAGLAAGAAAAPADARRKCRKDSPAGQCCRRNGTCTCLNGGAVCGADCCSGGETCQGGQCVAPPPPACLEAGAACKGTGRACCAGLVCASGQGGQDDVACHVGKLGPCTQTAQCAYGLQCRDGACQVIPPAPPPPTCNAQLGELCDASTVCCVGTCATVIAESHGGARQPEPTDRCCLPAGGSCSSDSQCCCPDEVAGCYCDTETDPSNPVCINVP